MVPCRRSGFRTEKRHGLFGPCRWRCVAERAWRPGRPDAWMLGRFGGSAVRRFGGTEERRDGGTAECGVGRRVLARGVGAGNGEACRSPPRGVPTSGAGLAGLRDGVCRSPGRASAAGVADLHREVCRSPGRGLPISGSGVRRAGFADLHREACRTLLQGLPVSGPGFADLRVRRPPRNDHPALPSRGCYSSAVP